MNVIEVRGLRCSCVVGALAHEREARQPLEFDVDLERSFAAAARDDDLAATTNYARVTSLVVAVATEGRFVLLETLAQRVGERLLELDPAIEAVVVAVRKLRPPVEEDVATVGVRCRVARV